MSTSARPACAVFARPAGPLPSASGLYICKSVSVSIYTSKIHTDLHIDMYLYLRTHTCKAVAQLWRLPDRNNKKVHEMKWLPHLGDRSFLSRAEEDLGVEGLGFRVGFDIPGSGFGLRIGLGAYTNSLLHVFAEASFAGTV